MKLLRGEAPPGTEFGINTSLLDLTFEHLLRVPYDLPSSYSAVLRLSP